MIETRIKRALLAISILIGLGFGGYSAFQFIEAARLAAAGEEWKQLNESWYTAKCSAVERDPTISSLCNEAWRTRSFYSYAPYRARDEGAESLLVAVGVPLVLWSLFFVIRWIWTGVAWPRVPASEKPRPRITKPMMYWTLGVLGCALLFAVNAIVLPPGRAVEVVISSAVQGIGLVIVAWVVTKLRDARRKHNEK